VLTYNLTEKGDEMAILTEDQRNEMQAAGELPLRLTDPQTSREYVLVPAELYDRIRGVLYDDDEFRPADAYPLIDKVLAKSGWDDPEMDIYNDFAPPGEP
jgi:hypothetical protein